MQYVEYLYVCISFFTLHAAGWAIKAASTMTPALPGLQSNKAPHSINLPSSRARIWSTVDAVLGSALLWRSCLKTHNGTASDPSGRAVFIIMGRGNGNEGKDDVSKMLCNLAEGCKSFGSSIAAQQASLLEMIGDRCRSVFATMLCLRYHVYTSSRSTS